MNCVIPDNYHSLLPSVYSCNAIYDFNRSTTCSGGTISPSNDHDVTLSECSAFVEERAYSCTILARHPCLQMHLFRLHALSLLRSIVTSIERRKPIPSKMGIGSARTPVISCISAISHLAKHALEDPAPVSCTPRVLMKTLS